MKKTTFLAITTSVMWISVAAVIIYALYITEKTTVLWFFLIPAISGYSVKQKSGQAEKKAGGS